MAIERNVNSIGMKMVSNYGTVDGEVLRKSKTYKNVKAAATDTAILATYKALDGLQQPTAENCYVVTTEELVETV
ncbi:MAG: hypothetical protein VB030_08205 [Eubacterium aggregans]|uniref:DUF1659 domain-containing protein n=1 Tax=Eubacterium aggregans TaxID=81409 RepID=A0A1H4AFE3_9FIRM|nr:hypothetical protein [Eubacterium aggregans]MDD4692373.1 hypothetical protein [Eubacterium aggregans]MEA5074141.1 hypothetical protein [Eubacterium aggregans]SEA34725.1 hypothetical protein SAMN04515656_10852 [Eubacterium aggregans]